MRLKHLLSLLILSAAATALAQTQLPNAPAPVLAQATAPQPLPVSQAHFPISSASINGTVTDVNNDPIPQASIQLTGPVTHPIATADANGFFKLGDLPAGTYQIIVSAKGFADFARDSIQLKPGENLDLQAVTLQVAGANTTVNAVSYTQKEIATQQVHMEESQRLIGVIPNFYVVYDKNFAPLSAGQKFSLTWRSALDPTAFAIIGIVAGIEQQADTFPEWGQDWAGYGQRYGAAYASATINLVLTGDILPTLLHQDPRYFYKGTGSIRSRTLYAIGTSTVICKGDNGKWQPNYSNVIGTFAAGGISNLYYPTQNGASLVFYNGLINIASEAANGIIQEFVLRHFTSHAKKQK
jgi:Carboxypeptidase regulatory-like domain